MGRHALSCERSCPDHGRCAAREIESADDRKVTAVGEYRNVMKELRDPTIALRDEIPETWEGFAHMHKHAVADGALSAAVKEMIALAIAATEGCDGCIAYHARAAAKQGASREQVAEALGVALLMRGGPASVHAPRALSAFDEFAGVVH
jgi:AhpD family alkylhydroperoxidase